MYKIEKPRGYTSILLTNTETHASIRLSEPTIDILEILKKDRIIFSSTTEPHDDSRPSLSIRDEWNFEVSTETGKELAHTALKLKTEKKIHTEQPKKNNKNIDAMDVLLGLASYN